MNIYILNNTENTQVVQGYSILPNNYFLIPESKKMQFCDDSDLLFKIANADCIISKTEDSLGHIIDINCAINYLKNNLPTKTESISYPFAAKTLPDGKKLYTRVHGITASVQNTPDTIDFIVPYVKCKISGIEFINGGIGDKANFKIVDTPTGTVSGVANAVLNQFGFNTNIGKDYYKYESSYDADLIQDFKIRIEYDAVDDLLPKIIYINIFLHEIVD